MNKTRVLIVDDEPEKMALVRGTLEMNACEVRLAPDGQTALEMIDAGPIPDLVLMDLIMPGWNGLQTLEKLRTSHPNLRVVMLSTLGDTRTAVAAARMGAMDYLTKPLHEEDLQTILDFARLSQVPVGDGADAPGVVSMGDGQFCLIAGPAMQRVYQQVLQVAVLDVPVLVLGESGTGKEVIAKLIQLNSSRAGGPLIKVNCAALPNDLLESELFGYEAGAFTGALKSKPGKFALANQGTIFLDEIAEMSPGLQAKLLHVLQDGSYTSLGGTKLLTANVRVISATNVKIQQAIVDQKFRKDLYYRLNTFTIQLPPLRERRQEIPVLLRHFMARFAQDYGRAPLPFSATLMERSLAYDWPGNLRELENFIKRYLILGDETSLVEELGHARSTVQVPAAPKRPNVARGGMLPDLKSMVRSLQGEAEVEVIVEALRQCGGVRKEAAQKLNISYKALLQKIRRHGLDNPTPRIGDLPSERE